ncbi:protein of unknown function [Clostridium cavendishii DSM 21758]|uniref:IrrE N-terminal-like domain-containing protein n=1 Tax=Clostridium cavendishii DSM 21758 TaxID=1121302 RepID=A0A1M6HRV9_9CLOT|nr:ImmA/IrrE family metallo-endopeptidase [Clostridium cavendishii]SHJ24932.1 protein of unknown function [Clostridium cavendishii DSM 21758]
MNSWIDTIVMGLKETYDSNDIYTLYDYLNIQIVKLESRNILLHGNEAFYNRNFLDREMVFIRNDLDLNIEKFILAHELGHALLHTKALQSAFNKNLTNIGKLEKQANYFAFKLFDIELNPIELDGFSLNQISSYTGLPCEILKIFY